MTSHDALHLRARLAANLREAQERSGMSGREIADAVGATPDQFSKWRRGEVSPGLPYLIRLADLLVDGEVAYFYAERPHEREAA